VAAARAANTLKGYRSDWAEWCGWCVQEGLDPLAGEAAAISRYLVFLAGVGAKVGTMARRLSAMRFAFRMRGLPDPTGAARVSKPLWLAPPRAKPTTGLTKLRVTLDSSDVGSDTTDHVLPASVERPNARNLPPQPG
jgi:hypothetical protein